MPTSAIPSRKSSTAAAPEAREQKGPKNDEQPKQKILLSREERAERRSVLVPDVFDSALQTVAEGGAFTPPEYAAIVREVAPLPHPERRALLNALYEAASQAGEDPGKRPSRYRRVPHQQIIEEFARGAFPVSWQEADSACWDLQMAVFQVDDEVRAIRRKQGPLSSEDELRLIALDASLDELKILRTQMRDLRSALRTIPKKSHLADSGVTIQTDLHVGLPSFFGAEGGGGLDLSPRKGPQNRRELEPYFAVGAQAGIWSYTRVRGTERKSRELETEYLELTNATNHAILGNYTSVRPPGSPLGVAVNDRKGLGVIVRVGLPTRLPLVPRPFNTVELQLFFSDPRLEYASEKIQQKMDVFVEFRDRVIERVKRKIQELLGDAKYAELVTLRNKLP